VLQRRSLTSRFPVCSRVQNLFHSVQLNVNNPHFLIMQGRITKVLNMKPPEILSMLEEVRAPREQRIALRKRPALPSTLSRQAAGTRMYETKKENALKTLDKKQTKVEEINKARRLSCRFESSPN
jgi:structural maintenance of chromosome 2